QPDFHVRSVHREHQYAPRWYAGAEPEFAVIGEIVPLADVREPILEGTCDVPRPEERLESGPAPHLALVAVRRNDALRLEVHLLLETLRPHAANPAVVLQDRGRGRLQPDVGAGLRGLFGDRFVERVLLEDDTDLVHRIGLLDRELHAVRL